MYKNANNAEVRHTRSMARLRNGSTAKRSNNATPRGRVASKRHTKSIEKEQSSVNESEIEEIKSKYMPNYSKRERYFNQGNAIYQEYDNFLRKRRKDRRVEFIKNTREPNEEVISLSNNKDLLKYFGAPANDQDTFCYCNTVSYDEMIACDNPK